MKKLFIAIVFVLILQIAFSNEMKEIYSGTITFLSVDVYKKFDTNGDDIKDSLVLSSRNVLYIIDGKGLRTLHRFPSIINDISEIDINRDNIPEILVLSDKIYVLDFNGNVLLKINDTGSSICGLDFDNDGYNDEIALGKGGKFIIYEKDGKIFERSVGVTTVKLKCNKNILIAYSSKFLDVYVSNKNVLSKIYDENIIDIDFIDMDKDDKYNDIGMILSDGSVYIYKNFKEYYKGYVAIDRNCFTKAFAYDMDFDGYKESFAVISLDLVFFKDRNRYVFGIATSCPDSFDLIDLDGDGILDDIIAGRKGEDGYITVMNSGKVVYKFKFKIKNEEEKEIESERYNKTAADFLFSLDLDNDKVMNEFVVIDLTSGKYHLLKPNVMDKTKRKEKKIILVANGIDYNLSKDFRDLAIGRGHQIIHISAKEFFEYRNSRYIIILGGHKAYEGIGDIVKSLLKTLPVYEYENYIKKIEEEYAVILLKDVYIKGQVIYIIAGRDRYKTREALMKKGLDVLKYLEEI